MLTIRTLSHAIAGKPLFEECSVTVPGGHRVGIVGRNGTGKTTLFRLILGDLEPDLGDISIPEGTKIGTVAQEVPGGPESLIAVVLAADTERAALLAEAETADDPARIAEIQIRLQDIGAHSAEARAASILRGLGFSAEDQLRPTSEFSGGWRMRVALAGVLFAEPDLLLLDEPTNYLDLEGTIWLETYLAKYPHTVMIISHDRGLLNRTANHILHLSQKKLTLYRGNFDQFDQEYRAKAAQSAAAAKKQEAHRAHMQAFVDRFRYKASKARQAQSRLKMLAKLEPIASLSEGAVRGFRFPNSEELSAPLLALDSVTAGYGDTPILKKLDLRIDPDDRIALLGANGQGKSTLAKTISGLLPLLSGKRVNSAKLRIGFFQQHQMDNLDPDRTPLEELGALRPGVLPPKLRAILADGGIGADIASTKIAALSGGQKARLALLLITLDAPHLVILDEPTNHLDMESREALVSALTEYEGAVILVSHDPHLVSCVADRLWLVDQGRVAPFDGDMEAYRAYLLKARGAAHDGKPENGAPKPAKKTVAKVTVASLRDEVKKSEERVEKLEDMLSQIDARLADPDVHSSADAADRLEKLNKKRAEVVAALQRAEDLWVSAQERLDRAS